MRGRGRVDRGGLPGLAGDELAVTRGKTARAAGRISLTGGVLHRVLLARTTSTEPPRGDAERQGLLGDEHEGCRVAGPQFGEGLYRLRQQRRQQPKLQMGG